MTDYRVPREGGPAHQAENDDISEGALADELKELMETYTEEGGNDIQSYNVNDIHHSGRVVNVQFTNGQRFRILVEEL